MREPFLLMVAPNGARRTKRDHPNLPITLDETVEAVARAQEAGANAAHVHVRDDAGVYVLDAARYNALQQKLRAECGEDFLVQITTEAVGRYSAQEQRAVVRDVGPHAVSIAVQELLANREDDAQNGAFLAELASEGTAVQWICYSPADLEMLNALMGAGVVPSARSLLFVLGRYAVDQQSQPADILPFLQMRASLPNLSGSQWSVCAFGSNETACLLTALLLGGDGRIGFENSLWHADGSVASSNASRVAEVVTAARALSLTPASVADAFERWQSLV